MTDRPIIFSGPMVAALIAGRKTQTRRVLRPQPLSGGFWRDKPRTEPCGWTQEQWDQIYSGEFPDGSRCAQSFPYAAGDTLWVREAWRVGLAYEDLRPAEMSGEEIVDWLAGSITAAWSMGRKRSPIHMPRWASRLTLTVSDVRVQRLQEISDADAIAEGVQPFGEGTASVQTKDGVTYSTPRSCFAVLWESIHGKDAWAANPWVAALTFSVERRNIDAVAP